MVKDNETVIEHALFDPENDATPTPIREFNELVNMTAKELEEWLRQEQSESSGWDKGDGSSETTGHER